MKTIHAHIFDPRNTLFKSNRNDKAECYRVECSRYEDCGLYKRGECSWIKPFGYQRCPYGKFYKEFGFTRRANNFYKWISDRKEKYKDCLDKLVFHKEKLAVVGDYIFLPYSFMDMNESIQFIAHGGFLRKECSFIPEEQFTIDNIINICEFRPQAVMGDEIRDYQNKSVPKFIKHLSEEMPEICDKLCDRYERARIVLSEYSYIGREAYLNTINPNVGKLVDIHGGSWIWDGEYLTSSNSKISFGLVNKFTEIKIKPVADKSIIKITDNNQVNDNTKFIE